MTSCCFARSWRGADKFRFEQTASGTSWMLDLFRRTRALRALSIPFTALNKIISNLHIRIPGSSLMVSKAHREPSRVVDALWIVLVGACTGYAAWRAYEYLSATLGPADVLRAFGYGLLTLIRVVVLIALASLIWVPVGVWIGLRPRIAELIQPLAQFLAAFPANLAFPVFVVVIVRYGLNANVWLSPLMILGTQWYILFKRNRRRQRLPERPSRGRGEPPFGRLALVGESHSARHFPLLHHGSNHRVRRLLERLDRRRGCELGRHHLQATGLGAYIAKATEAGDFPRVVLGITVMCILVTLFNRLLWRPLYAFGERRLRLG